MPIRWKLTLSFLTLLFFLLLLASFSIPDPNLHLIACDVGQGDAFLLTQANTQILIDGGPNDQVLDCLSDHLPFWDRTLELVILTHPQTDHFTGLIPVLKRYQVDYFLTSSLENNTQSFQVLKNQLGGSTTKVLDPIANPHLRIGKISLDILWPIEGTSVLGVSSTISDLNNFSIVTSLKFGQFDALFTGDIEPRVIAELITLGRLQDVDYLKIPHHGSKNGLTSELLEITKPEVAVISVGKNQWGHPHPEILDLLTQANTQTLRTDQLGDIEIITSGTTWWLQN